MASSSSRLFEATPSLSKEEQANVARNLIIKTGLELFSPESLATPNHSAPGGQ